MKIDIDRKAAAQNGGVRQAFDDAISLERQAFISSLKCMYFCMKREIAHTTNYGPLLDLAAEMGCTYLTTIEETSGHRYRSERTMQEMVLSIGKVVQDEILQQLRESEFFSVLIDETTDISVSKQLIVYVKYLLDGEPVVRFLDNLEVDNGTADCITTRLVNYFHQKEVPLITKLVGFGSDGASVMTGCRNGVAKQLKDISQLLVANHCVAHRLALASAQGAAEVPYVKRFNSTLDHIFRFYEYSAVRMKALRLIQEAMENPTLKPKQAKDVRWLSHEAACSTIKEILPSLIVSLQREAEERHEPQAAGLNKFVECWKFVATLHMMCDILPHLARLSKCFQATDLNYCNVKDLVENTLAILEARLTIPGQHYARVRQALDTLNNEGFNVAYRDEDLEDHKKHVHDKFISCVMAQIKRRFPDTGVMAAFSIFSGRDFPVAASLETLENYGSEELETLLDKFGDILDTESTIQEFTMLKHLMQNQYQLMSAEQTMVAIAARHADAMPNLLKLTTIARLVPSSTADCEQGFSCLKRVKTELRNRLSQPVLNSLVRVSIHGGDVTSFDFSAAADNWAALRNRRLDVRL